ncbi:MAG: ATP/GTP-binding protein, partial [uncultured Nocardioidaceae bacterium]
EPSPPPSPPSDCGTAASRRASRTSGWRGASGGPSRRQLERAAGDRIGLHQDLPMPGLPAADHTGHPARGRLATGAELVRDGRRAAGTAALAHRLLAGAEPATV